MIRSCCTTDHLSLTELAVSSFFSLVGGKVVFLGLELSEVEDSSQRIVLYYTDILHDTTQEAASFKMGELTGRWARFTLTMQGSEVAAAVLHAHSPLQHGLFSSVVVAAALCVVAARRCACTWTVRNTTEWPSTGASRP